MQCTFTHSSHVIAGGAKPNTKTQGPFALCFGFMPIGVKLKLLRNFIVLHFCRQLTAGLQ